MNAVDQGIDETTKLKEKVSKIRSLRIPGYQREDLKSAAAFQGGDETVTVRQKGKYCDVCVTFKEWLAKNGHRFNRKCKIRHYNKGTSIPTSGRFIAKN